MASIQLKVGDESKPTLVIQIEPTGSVSSAINTDGPSGNAEGTFDRHIAYVQLDDVATTETAPTVVEQVKEEVQAVLVSGAQTAGQAVEEVKEVVESALNADGKPTEETIEDGNQGTDNTIAGADKFTEPAETPSDIPLDVRSIDKPTEKVDTDPAPVEETAHGDPEVTDTANMDTTTVNGDPQEDAQQVITEPQPGTNAQEAAPSVRRASVFMEVEDANNDGMTTVAVIEPPTSSDDITTVHVETIPIPQDDTSTLNGGAPSTTGKKSATVTFDSSVSESALRTKPRKLDRVRTHYPDFFLTALFGVELRDPIKDLLNSRAGKSVKLPLPPLPDLRSLPGSSGTTAASNTSVPQPPSSPKLKSVPSDPMPSSSKVPGSSGLPRSNTRF